MQFLLRLLPTLAVILWSGPLPVAAAERASAGNLYAELNPARVPGVEVRELTATSAVLEWPAGLSPGPRFRVEVRHFAADAEAGLQMRWEEYPGATIERRGDTWRARLLPLLPRQPHWFRVLPAGGAGGEVAPLFAVRFQTPEREPIVNGRGVLVSGLGAMLAALLWLRWRRARG